MVPRRDVYVAEEDHRTGSVARCRRVLRAHLMSIDRRHGVGRRFDFDRNGRH